MYYYNLIIVSWQEPSGTQITPRNLRITPVDIASWKPPEHDIQKNRKILQSTVTQNLPDLTNLNSKSATSESGDILNNPQSLKEYKLGRNYGQEYSVHVPASTPWFESWRETFLKLHSEQSPISQHEFMNNFMACILVISSSEAKNQEELANIIGKLSKLQQQHQMEWPHTWILPSVLKFYIILHDNSDDSDLSRYKLRVLNSARIFLTL